MVTPATVEVVLATLPPQTISSLPVQARAWSARASGAPRRGPWCQRSWRCSYQTKSSVSAPETLPPNTIIWSRSGAATAAPVRCAIGAAAMGSQLPFPRS